ncbi:MAG: hypothetical protein KBS45_01230 [Clostridiales bacterium]|nr:hypothetical protein [Candidatus Coliplasma caballi]
MKRTLSVLLAVLLLALTLGVAVSAEAMLDPDVIISDLTPCKDMEKDLVLNGCTVSFDRDGVATFTLTATTATVHIDYADVKNNIVLYGSEIMPADGAFFVIDYGTLDNVSLQDTFWHYTRKDKEAAGTVADLYLKSMNDDPSYASYSSVNTKENGAVSVWDWGTYVASSDAKLFTDKGHYFTSMELTMVGTVGAEVTFYTIAVTNTDELEGLGEVRPEPKEPEEPSDEPVESSEEPTESTEEPAESPEDPTESSEEPAESSEAPAESSEEPATSAEESKAESKAEESKPADDEGGLSTGAIIGIVIGAIVVIGGAVAGIILAKKKK